MTRSLAGLGVLLSALGCATSPYHRAGSSGEVAAALARSNPPPAPGRSLAFLVLAGAGGPRLAAYDLAESRLLWTQPAEVTTRVEVGPDVIVHGTSPAGGDASNAILTARDLGNGAQLWQRVMAGNERLYGYALEGNMVFLVVQTAGPTAKTSTGTVLALDARTGVLKWKRLLPSARVAAPAARGGVVAVPLESQYVFLLDAATGQDLAQVLSTEEAASFVRALPEGLFYGSRGIFLLGPSTARGSRQAPGFLRARFPAFVRPFYWYDHYRPEQTRYSALDRNRVLWRVTAEGERARFRDDLVFVHHYRFFFGFEAAAGTLRWAYAHPSDAVASMDNGRAIVFVTADGELGALDRTSGARVYEARLPGEVVLGATLDVEGFTPSGAPLAGGPDLTGTLATIISDPDMRFPDLKVFAIEELGKQPGKEVSAKLLDILTKEGLPTPAYRRAGEALVARRDTGAIEQLASALRHHADYAEAKQPPPVDLLARAIGRLGPAGRIAGPELVSHLRRPETPPLATAEIARTLAAIGAEEAAPALRDFLTMYRADPVYAADPSALLAAAEALLKLGEAGDRELLLFLAEEPHTTPALRAHLGRALRATAVPKVSPDGAPPATLRSAAGAE